MVDGFTNLGEGSSFGDEKHERICASEKPLDCPRNGSSCDSSDLTGPLQPVSWMLRLFFLIFILVFPACRSDGVKSGLVIYSTHGKELLTKFEALFEKNNPTIDVQWLDMGSQDVLDRLRSEKENPQADLWWGAPSILFQQGERERL